MHFGIFLLFGAFIEGIAFMAFIEVDRVCHRFRIACCIVAFSAIIAFCPMNGYPKSKSVGRTFLGFFVYCTFNGKHMFLKCFKEVYCFLNDFAPRARKCYKLHVFVYH